MVLLGVFVLVGDPVSVDFVALVGIHCWSPVRCNGLRLLRCCRWSSFWLTDLSLCFFLILLYVAVEVAHWLVRLWADFDENLLKFFRLLLTVDFLLVSSRTIPEWLCWRLTVLSLQFGNKARELQIFLFVVLPSVNLLRQPCHTPFTQKK